MVAAIAVGCLWMQAHACVFIACCTYTHEYVHTYILFFWGGGGPTCKPISIWLPALVGLQIHTYTCT